MNRAPRVVLIYTVLLFAVSFPCMAFELPDGVVTASKLNVHRREDMNSRVFWLLYKGDRVKIKSVEGDWYKVDLPGGKSGFVHNEYLDVIVWARVLNDNVPVYCWPDTAAESAGSLNGISWIRVTNRNGAWVEVEFTNGAKGWVSRRVLEVPEEFFSSWLALRGTSRATTAQAYERPSKSSPGKTAVVHPRKMDPPPSITTRSRIVDFARRYMGTPYRYGGESLEDGGFDCSGFVYFVYGNFGVQLERVSRDQARMGTRVAKEDLMPGDLVFFDTRSRPKGIVNHAGIYIGNGQFIHSSSGKASPCVKISSLTDDFYSSHYLVGRRVLD